MKLPSRGVHLTLSVRVRPMPLAGFVTDPLCLDHDYPGHPERPERLSAILEHLERTGLRARMVELSARDVTDDEVLAVHDRRVLDAQAALAARGGGMADADTYVTPSSPAAARRAAGAVLVALEAVLAGPAAGGVRSAFAAARPPGHHATRETMMGFCLLNNVAIAAAAAFRAGVERVAVVDWDVHHGNGTQAIFDADPRLLYVSTHAAPFYPGTGHYLDAGRGEAAGTKVNVPLTAGTSDRGFVAAYERVVLPAIERFRPELLLVSCGWDAHARDPLAPLNVTTDGYTRVAQLVLDAASTLCEGRMVVALEGGYDTHALAWCAGALCELLLGDTPTPDPGPVFAHRGAPEEPDVEPLLEAVRRAVGLSA